MTEIDLTRRYRFSASHRLHAAGLSAEENREIYGKCNNPHGHGHDYVLDVTVRGGLDERTGTLVPVAKLDAFVRRQVIDFYDHRDLNREVAEFRALVPTAENIALSIGGRLRRAWAAEFGAGQPALERVRVRETGRNTIELEGRDI